jgi:hypothetical protein
VGLDRTTTQLKGRDSRTAKPKEEKKGFFYGVPSLRSPTYVSEAPLRPGHFYQQHGPTFVLLVEENLINQRILSQQLRKEGCAMATADNGLEAL